MYYVPKKKKSSFPFKNELLAIAGCAGALFVFISLCTFSMYDNSWFYYHSATTQIHNACGIIGVQCAAFCMYMFGGASFLVPVFMLFFSCMPLLRQTWHDEWDRFIAVFCLLPLTASLLYMYGLDPVQQIVPGGRSGFLIIRALRFFFDKVGAFIVVHAFFLIALILVFRLSLLAVLQSSFVALRAFVHKLMPLVAAALYYSSRPLRYAYAWLCSLWRADDVLSSPDSIVDFEQAVSTMMRVGAEDVAFWQQHTNNEAPLSSAQELKAHEEFTLAEQSAPLPQPVQVSHDAAQEHHQKLGALQVYDIPRSELFEARHQSSEEKKVIHELKARARILEEKLERFGVSGSVIAIKPGPVITLFEYEPHIDTKISKIISLEDDLAMALQALSIRIIAPIPGRSVVGFEVANQSRASVYFSNIIHSKDYQQFSGALPLVLGEDTVGGNVIVDLAKMPHLLVAGSTGSGKSVALNTMLISMLCSKGPDELKLILIDPKRLEFVAYTDIAHLLFPLITDTRKAAPVLKWVVQTMEERYERMAKVGVRTHADYNQVASAEEYMPYIVVVIDELADLMMTAGADIEMLLTRLSQMARAAGIHLVVATQRPSVDVITGLIKANFTCRISFKVTSKIDSRTILDMSGAEKLLGRGDMLFLNAGTAQVQRAHGAFVSDEEIATVINHIRAQRTVEYLNIEEELAYDADLLLDTDDALYKDILSYLQEVDEVSISLLQRRFRIGYNRSARIIDALESQGKIMPADGGKGRKVIR